MKTFYLALIGIMAAVPLAVSAASLKQALKQGATGDDVKVLQALLAADASVYPQALITGYYGPLTSQAVKQLQKKYGIVQTGTVGPLTLAVLNKINTVTPVEVRVIPVASTQSTTTTVSVVCQKIPPGHLVAPGWIKKNGKVQILPECQVLPPGIAKQATGVTTTPPVPDTTAPVISLLAYSASTTSIRITWTTDEYATTYAYFSTTSPVSAINATMRKIDGYRRNHDITLTELVPGTQYYFYVASADDRGNVATSSQVAMITATTADTTAPTFTWIIPYPFSTVATVMWVTNEPSTGKLYYATTSPIVLASSTLVSAPTLSMSQSLALTGLTASTTYYFVIEAKDGSGNTSTSTLQSFRTQ